MHPRFPTGTAARGRERPRRQHRGGRSVFLRPAAQMQALSNSREGVSLSPSTRPKRDLEFLQPFLDRAATIQGKIANPREQPTDCDTHPGKYDPSLRPHPRYIFTLRKAYHYIYAASLEFVVK